MSRGITRDTSMLNSYHANLPLLGTRNDVMSTKYLVFPLIRLSDFAPGSNALISGVPSFSTPTTDGTSDFGASSWAAPMRIDCDPKSKTTAPISSPPYNMLMFVFLISYLKKYIEYNVIRK